MEERTCSVQGCERGGRLKRGWCGMHYLRWRKHGDPLATAKVGRPKTPDAQRFWSHVNKTDGGCWLWEAGTDRGGYGRFEGDGHEVAAHRWSYEDAVGPIVPGLDLDHLCRVRRCVNPAHLEPVTRQVNLLRGAQARHLEATGREWQGPGSQNFRDQEQP